MAVPKLHWVDDERVVVDGVEFACGFDRGGSATHLPIWKPRDLIEQYVDEVERRAPTRIVELGIAAGGSTALLTLLAGPRRLVAADRSPDRIPALDDFLTRHDPGGAVHLHHGVDQADAPTLRRILDDEFGATTIDLVVDDASHLLAPTRTSFEVVFPRLRPGGRYLIEDWSWEHAGAERVSAELARLPADPHPARVGGRTPIAGRLTGRAVRALSGTDATEIPLDGPYASLVTGRVLSLLAIELLLARARSGDAVASVEVDGHWIAVTRGPGELDRDTFRLTDLYEDHFGLLGGPVDPATHEP